MKRIYQVGVLAVAALAYISCNTELDNSEPGGLLRTVEVSFTKDIDTKTAVVEGIENASYVWTEGDEDYLHVYENGKEGTIENISYSDDMKVATLSVSFTTATAEEYSYTAVYGSNLSNYNETTATGGNPLIPAEQKPTQTSFDPAADILVSREITSKDPQEKLAFTMGRVVTVNKMTLTGLENGEIVSSVEFALDKNISARYMVNGNNKGKFDSSGSSQKLTFSYDDANPVSDGSFPVYFIAAPVEDAGIKNVVVITDKNVYTKSSSLDPNPFEGKKISFSVGTMKRFTMNMKDFGKEIEEPVDYTLVESSDLIVDGAEYLIVYETNAMASFNSGNYYDRTPVNVNVEDNVITISGQQVQIITLEDGDEEGQFYMKDSDGFYLYYNSNSGNAVSRSVQKNGNKSLWTVTIDRITNVGDTERYLQYNSSSSRFACYTTSSKQKDVNLYVNLKTVVERADPELAYDKNSFDILWDERESFEKPELSNPHALPVTYSSSNLKVVTVEENTGEITFVGSGTTTITASSEKTEKYKAGKAFYQLTVTDPNKEIEKGEEWKYVFTGKVFDTNVPSAMLEGRTWTMVTDNDKYLNYDNSRGHQFGSGNQPMKLLTLSSDFGEAYGVETVIVNASMASSADATLSVSVGGVSLKCNDNTEIALLTTSASNYEFKASTLLTGEIKITLSQTTSKALYVKSISVNSEVNDGGGNGEGGDGGGTTEPEPGENIFESDAAFVCSKDDSDNGVYTLSTSKGNTTFNGEVATGFRLGTSGKVGKFVSAAVDVEGDHTLTLYGVAWKGEKGTLKVCVEGGGSVEGTDSYDLTSNDGAAANVPYTITVTESDYYTFNLKGLTAKSTIVFESTSEAKRVVVAGIHME